MDKKTEKRMFAAAIAKANKDAYIAWDSLQGAQVIDFAPRRREAVKEASELLALAEAEVSRLNAEAAERLLGELDEKTGEVAWHPDSVL